MSEQDVIDEIGAEPQQETLKKLKVKPSCRVRGTYLLVYEISQGVCYRWLGHFEKAIDAYHASLALDPVDPMIVELALQLHFSKRGS